MSSKDKNNEIKKVKIPSDRIFSNRDIAHIIGSITSMILLVIVFLLFYLASK